MMTMIAMPALSTTALIDMATTATTSGGAPKLSHTYTSSTHRRLNPAKFSINSTKFLINNTKHSSISILRHPFTVQASNKPQLQDQDSTPDNDTDAAASISQEDLNYLWKLGAGSFVGSAVIKYGSIVFPEITRPNIWLALIMISTPVVIAVWLLIRQSRAEQRS